jgi:hypothetical protein
LIAAACAPQVARTTRPNPPLPIDSPSCQVLVNFNSLIADVLLMKLA